MKKKPKLNIDTLPKYRRRRKHVPEWMKDDAQVEAFLNRRFPNRVNDDRQRHAASKYWHVIDGYRRGTPVRVIARDWLWGHVPESYIHRLAQRVRQAYANIPLDGKPRSFGKPGRPKKVSG